MAATDARPIPRKNAAYRVTFPLLDADGDLVTGAAGLDSEVSKDAGAFTDCTNEATEIATASGMYYLDLTAAEMNADTVAIIIKTSSTGAKTTPIVLYPEEAGDIRVDVVQISGDAAAADNLESYTDGTTPQPVDVTYWLGAAAPANTGDAFARLGAPAGASIAADVADVEGKVDDLETRLTAQRATNLDNLDAAVSSRSTYAGGAVASVTGNVGGNVAGSVGSVTAAVTVGTNNDKTGYALSSAGVQAVWDALASALTTASSIGKLLVDNINATISSRLAAAAYTAPDNAGITAIKAKTDALPSDPADQSAVEAAVTAATAALATQASVNTIDDFLDTEIAAIKAKTDQLTFTTANQVDAGVRSMAADVLDATALAAGAATEIATAVWASATRTLTGIAAGVIAAAARNELADSILDRDMATGTDSGSATVRTVRNALRPLRNKTAIAGGALTVTKEDDSTTAWTAAVTTTAGNPISAIDPASS